MDIKKIQYLAGHSDIKVTLGIYSHVVGNTPDELISAVESALAKNFGGQTEKMSTGESAEHQWIAGLLFFMLHTQGVTDSSSVVLIESDIRKDVLFF